METSTNMDALAWNDASPAGKRLRLELGMIKSKKCIKEGRLKEAYLGLGSVCIDVLNSSLAGQTEEPTKHEAWAKLHKDCRKVARETYDSLVLANLDRSDWTSSDYEVCAKLLTRCADPDDAALCHAEDMLELGCEIAEAVGNYGSMMLIKAEQMRISMLGTRVNPEKTARYVAELTDMVHSEKGKSCEPKVLTRVWRAIAIGARHNAMSIAKKAGLKSQDLKARGIQI